MHVFVTGATGWVGSALVRELLEQGHRVTGLARDPAKAETLGIAGADWAHGTLDDHDLLRRHASEADAVAHLAFNHDFSRFAENAAQDARAIEVLGAALEGTRKPLVVTSGLALLAAGRVAVETDVKPATPAFPRKSEETAMALRARGVRASIVRLAPTTHGLGEYGFTTILAGLARDQGVSAYVGEGRNQWTAVHRSDAARLFRLALEHGGDEPAWHAVAEEAIAFRDVATLIGRNLGLPVESRDAGHFGWFGNFAAMDMPASSTITRRTLGWEPTGPKLAEDLAHPDYFAS